MNKRRKPPPAATDASAAQRALELDRKLEREALTRPSLPPRFLSGGQPCIELEARDSVVHVCQTTRDPETGQSVRTSMIETAYASFRSSDPKQRCAAMALAAQSSMVRAVALGRAPEAETEMMLALCQFLVELLDGKRNSPLMPEQRPSGLAALKAEAYATLAELIECRRKRDVCNRELACSRVARDLDAVLRKHDARLSDWLGNIHSKPGIIRGEPLHGLARAMKKWLDDGDIPTQDSQYFNRRRKELSQITAEAGVRGERALAALYPTMLRFTANVILQNIK